MPTAAVNGTGLYYEVRGQGPVCLTLHGGLGFDHQHLLRSLAPLEQRMQMVYFDHRCNGRSGRPPIETLAMEQLAADADGLLERLGIPSAIVLGHSYGGFVAQEMALRHPARVRALILVDTTPGQLGTTESPDDEQGPPIPEEMETLMMTPPASDGEYASLASKMLPFYLHSRPASELQALIDGTIYSASAMMRGFEVLNEWSSVDRLAAIDVPVLLAWGRHDLICSLPQAKRIASRLRSAEIAVFDESGHFPWIEEPAAFFASVRDWLTRMDLA